MQPCPSMALLYCKETTRLRSPSICRPPSAELLSTLPSLHGVSLPPLQDIDALLAGGEEEAAPAPAPAEGELCLVWALWLSCRGPRRPEVWPCFQSNCSGDSSRSARRWQQSV